MKTQSMAVLALGAIFLVGAPAAAYAESDGYTPTNPATPSLTGSATIGECNRDVPWISYDVRLTDPDSLVTSTDARLVMTDGDESVTVPLGTIEDGRLSGRVLWPGASVDENGVADGWPGWAFTDGRWVETDGNFGWTRGAITATLEVNPSLAVPLSYPRSTPTCTVDPPRAGSGAALATTGLSTAMLPIAVVGAVAVAVGGGVVLLRRRTSRR